VFDSRGRVAFVSAGKPDPSHSTVEQSGAKNEPFLNGRAVSRRRRAMIAVEQLTTATKRTERELTTRDNVGRLVGVRARLSSLV